MEDRCGSFVCTPDGSELPVDLADKMYKLASTPTDEVLNMPPGSWTMPLESVLHQWDVAITCAICRKDCINPPHQMTVFPVCDDCLNFLRKLKEHADELIKD